MGIRKKRDTSYTMTQRLLKKLGEGRVVEYWTKYGMYKASELLSIEMQEYVSPYVLRYMSNKYDWKRNCNQTKRHIQRRKSWHSPSSLL